MDMTNYVDAPVPGFKDEVGQTVVEGDWVVLAVNNSGGLRLARILEIVPEVRTRIARWVPKPEAEWSEWERRYASTRPPTKAEEEQYTYAKVTATQYADLRPKTKPIRRDVTNYEMLKYAGPIPFDLS